MTLGTEIQLSQPFGVALDRVISALAEEGFGVISRIDMDKAFKEKIGVDFRRYVILGACNPTLAHKAVSDTPEIGLMLPCNVTVEEADGGSTVRIIDPEAMFSPEGLPATDTLRELMTDASTRLDRVADKLRSA